MEGTTVYHYQPNKKDAMICIFAFNMHFYKGKQKLFGNGGMDQKMKI